MSQWDNASLAIITLDQLLLHPSSSSTKADIMVSSLPLITFVLIVHTVKSLCCKPVNFMKSASSDIANKISGFMVIGRKAFESSVLC